MANGETPAEQDPEEAIVTFHEQADGRKVARLPGGKVVLLDLHQIDRVADGERWRVRLRHRETFAIAEPIDLAREPLLSNPVLTPQVAARLAVTALRVEAVRPPPAASPLVPPAPPAAAVPAGGRPAPVPSAVPVAPAPVPARPGDIVRDTDRVALFIDGANMDGACRAARYFVDYRKARLFPGKRRVLRRLLLHRGLHGVRPLQQRYLDFLSHAGYIVRRRPVKVIRDQDTGERIIKGNLDTEIVLDMLNTVGNYDVAFLFSGDSDFERAVDLLRSRGKRLYVVTARSQISRELAYVADKPIFFLEDHQAPLSRDRTPIA